MEGYSETIGPAEVELVEVGSFFHSLFLFLFQSSYLYKQVREVVFFFFFFFQSSYLYKQVGGVFFIFSFFGPHTCSCRYEVSFNFLIFLVLIPVHTSMRSFILFYFSVLIHVQTGMRSHNPTWNQKGL